MQQTYEQHETTRAFMELMRMQCHLTAQQTQAMLLPYQMWLNSPFNPMNYWHGSKLEMRGLNTLTSANPFLAGLTEKFPNSIEVNFLTTSASAQNAEANKDKKKLSLSLSLTEPHKNWEALAEIFNMAAKEYPKPDFCIDEATILGKKHKVKQSVLVDKPFASLRFFETDHKGPLLYIAAPISGHYSTLMRETIQSALNAGFRVGIYDIKNARDVSLKEGDFGLDDCVDYHREFISYLGKHIDPHVNVQAICQATVPVSIAAATLAEENSPYTPFTLDLEAGPINPHISMTEVSEFAQKYDLDWFKDNLISRVPAMFGGQGREVYPGFRQLAAFIAMNPRHHANSFYEMFNHLVRGTEDEKDYQKKAKFYEEYLAVADLPAKFYLDTIDHFINNKFANGTMTRHGKPVDLSAYQGHLLTKEAAEDDISAPGQTMFVHELMPEAKGYHYRVEEAGHYGIFAGSKARDKSLPAMYGHIHQALKENGHDYGPALDSYGNPLTKTTEMPVPYNKDMLDQTVKEQSAVWQEFVHNRENTTATDVPQLIFSFPGYKMSA